MTDYVAVVVRVANCAGVSNPRMAKHVTRRALAQPGVHGVPDVILLSEVSPVDVRELGSVTGHDVLQYGLVGSEQAGVAIAVNAETGHRLGRQRLEVGSQRTSEGGGIRMRPLVSDLVSVRGSKPKRFRSTHAAPPRAPKARQRMLAAIRRLGGFIGGDLNTRLGRLRQLLTRKVRGEGVLALLVPRGIRCSAASTVEIGSDHLAVDVVVYLPVRKPRTRKETR